MKQEVQDKMVTILQGDNIKIMETLPDESYRLIYIDPPFNTGKVKTDRNGTYVDKFDDFCAWIEPRISRAKELLTPDGSFFIHMDYREIHYVKVLCDQIFGRECFMNEIIWQYDFGARQKKKWSTKHDNILWYVKNPKNYIFNLDEVDLIPKLAPGLPTSKNRKNPHLKMLTDVWWNTIVPTNGKERVGYPTQKPMAIIERIIRVHSKPGDCVLDFFAGSGTTGDAARKLGRRSVLIDNNPQAVAVMKKRLLAQSEE